MHAVDLNLTTGRENIWFSPSLQLLGRLGWAGWWSLIWHRRSQRGSAAGRIWITCSGYWRYYPNTVYPQNDQTSQNMSDRLASTENIEFNNRENWKAYLHGLPCRQCIVFIYDSHISQANRDLLVFECWIIGALGSSVACYRRHWYLWNSKRMRLWLNMLQMIFCSSVLELAAELTAAAVHSYIFSF